MERINPQSPRDIPLDLPKAVQLWELAMKSWVVEPLPSSVWEGLTGKKSRNKPVEVGSFSRYFFQGFYTQDGAGCLSSTVSKQKSESNDTSIAVGCLS